MGVISIEQQDSLYWLGRYTERVYTTITQFSHYYDQMIDEEGNLYHAFCRSMEIPDIYTSQADFIHRYCYDESNPDSIISNLLRGFDNAIILREILGTRTFSYIQLAVYRMRDAAKSDSPLIDLGTVVDNIVAFWGMADDSMENDRARDLIKTGRRVERVDLYGRMQQPAFIMQLVVRRLTSYRLVRSGLGCNPERIQALDEMAHQTPIDYNGIVYTVEHLFE